MAKFNVVGLDDVQEAMLRQDAIVEEAVPEMLKAGGAVMQKAQQEEIKTRFNSRRSTGALLASIKVSAVFQPTRPLRGATAKVYKSLCTFLR